MSEDSKQALEHFAKLDLERAKRAGVPEVVYAEGKTVAQVRAITEKMVASTGRAIISRLPEGAYQQLSSSLSSLHWTSYANSSLAVVYREPKPERDQANGCIAVIAAGTSDVPIAEEAAVMAREMGCQVLQYNDVGVAGLHRLREPVEQINRQKVACVVAVAGMEGALPTVVKGLVHAPVIGVPTSVGYGLGRGGEAALMAMLNSCSLGVVVVNIDNGIGAGATAALIAKQLK